MKKIFLAVLAFASLAACTKVENFEEQVVAEKFTIKANIEDVKTTIGKTGKNTWSTNDTIAVFYGGKAYAFGLADGAGTSNGVFVCEQDLRGKTVNGVAAYPYSSAVALSGTKLTVNIPSAWAAESLPAPMAGKIDADGNYTFRNLMGILRVQYTNLPPAAEKLKITASNTICGNFTLNDYASSTISVPSTTTNNVVTVTIPYARPDRSAYIDIPVGAGSLSSIKAELIDNYGKNLNTTTTTSAKSFTVGHVKPLSAINIAGDRMTVHWIWDASIPTFRSSFPAIDDHGNVYVMTNEGAINKLSPDGQLLWRKTLNGVGGRVETSPSVEPDGSAVYVAAGQDGAAAIYALSSDGSIKWTFNEWPKTGNRNFWQTILGVGEKNLYVAVGTMCTMLSIDKATGKRVCYGSGKVGGEIAGLDGPGSGVAVGLGGGGSVTFLAQSGAFCWKKELLDNPVDNNESIGKYALYTFRDLWPGWGAYARDKQGVIAAKKGPTYGKDVIITCNQESKRRIDIQCFPATYVTEGTSYLNRLDNSTYNCYWRHQIGVNAGGAGDPADQDQGGIVMGHENLVVIIPMKYVAGATDPKIGEAGLYSVWVGRTDDGGTTCWRVTTGASNVSGAPAVDNNGHVHFATDGDYYIIAPNTANGGSYTVKAKIPLKHLLRSSGFIGDFNYSGCWSSVKIAKGGKIYLNVNISSQRGVTCCFSYPGVTGPDPTSSWPQKGADQYNSATQQL